ncbi:MAG: LCP family protein [Synergistaceae bacterium]|jgi:LCP family protein required for cell wall assembly|nr:LCP family protein [Synergistaceae bacterium]
MFNWKNVLLFVLLASFAFVVGAYARFVYIETPAPAKPGSYTEKEDTDKIPEAGKLDISGRINVLVLGEDNVEGSRRSDTILVAALDIDNENVRVLSIPRDTRMNIPGYGPQKVNHAYAYGKTELVRETVQRFLGAPISYYVKIDYDNFPKLVDLVGGVDIFVGKPMKYTDRRGRLEINIPAGKQRMNGETALKYVRFRKDARGDIGRVHRQQQFMKAMLHRMYEPENLLRFPAIIGEVKNTVATDVSPSMILQLGHFVRKMDRQTDRIFFMMLPGSASLIDDLSYWMPDIKAVDAFLKADAAELKNMMAEAQNKKSLDPLQMITGADDYSPDYPDGVKPPQKAEDKQSDANAANAAPAPKTVSEIVAGMPEAVAVLNGTGKDGVGSTVASHLQKMGIDVCYVGNAKHFDYRSSNIIYPADGEKTESGRLSAQYMATLCGIASGLVRQDKQAQFASLIIGHDYEKLVKRLEESYVRLQ